MTVLTGSIPVWAEEELSPEEIEEEIPEEEELIGEEDRLAEGEEYIKPEEVVEEDIHASEIDLTDKEAVAADKKALDIGFTRCVSRDLNFPKEGKNGTKISWKSSNPKVISDEGKFTCPKQITDLSVTATITKGDYKEEKKFNITANNRSVYDVIKDYVDTMVDYGRDTKLFSAEAYKNISRAQAVADAAGKSVIGRGRSGMFFSMLNRDTLLYPTFYVYEWPKGSFDQEQRGSGCATSQDIFLYEMLYDLTLLTGDKKYEKIADDALSFFLEYGSNPETGSLAWGDHVRYDPVAGGPNSANQYDKGAEGVQYVELDCGINYLMRSPFWQQKFYELNPYAWNKQLMSWWEAAVADPSAFSYSRHTHMDGTASTSGNYASVWGAMAPAYAWGYHLTGDQNYIEALNALMSWIERSSSWNDSYLYPQEVYYSSNRTREAWSGQVVDGSAVLYDILPLLPADLQERIERYVDRITNEQMKWDLSLGKNSFARYSALRTGQVTSYRTLTEGAGYYQRWAQLPEGEMKNSLGSAIIEWADKYLFYSLEDKLSAVEFIALDFTYDIDVLFTAYDETGDEKYLDRVLEMADFLIYDFWDIESMLPSMSHVQKKYYESTTGTSRVAWQMLRAHFLDVERKTGTNPQQQAWEKAAYAGRTMSYVRENNDFIQKTRYDYVKEEVTDEE